MPRWRCCDLPLIYIYNEAHVGYACVSCFSFFIKRLFVMALTFENVRKRFLASSPAAQYAVAIGGAGAAALSVLALMYPDRALFDEARPDIPQRAGYPLVGSLPDLIRNTDTFHHFALQGFENLARTTCV